MQYPTQGGLTAGQVQTAVNDGLNGSAMYQNPSANTTNDLLLRGGRTISQMKSFSASAGSETINVFELSGNIYVHRLYAIIGAVGLGNHTGAHFDLYGSTNADITDGLVGANLSSMSNGAVFYKGSMATGAIDFTDNPASAPFFKESDPSIRSSVFQGFMARSQVGSSTYIRYTYTTTDAPTQGDATFYITYTPLADVDWAVGAI